MICIKIKYVLFIIVFWWITSNNVYAHKIGSEDVIKIGIYDSKPYYSIDSQGNVSGYYDELLKLLQNKYRFPYEYVIYEFEQGIKALENGQIDLMFGISIKPERLENIVFSRNFIARERLSLLTLKDANVENLNKLEQIKIGLVEGTSGADKILDFFLLNNIQVDPVFCKNWNELEQLLDEGSVNLILHNVYKNHKYKSLYEFRSDQVYIAANEDREYLLKNIDKVIDEFNIEGDSSITILYNKYFDDDYIENKIEEITLLLVTIILITLVSTYIIIPRLEVKRIKNRIRLRLDNNKYILQYQPIFNPRTNKVVGFESLLRLVDEENNLIPPYKFIDEIEKNHMLFEVSIWILKKVVEDYNDIKECDCVKERDFYISLNLSLNEIEDEEFIKKSIDILSQSKLGTHKICLEIIERVKLNDIDKIVKNIARLKEAGFKIAIDDFGIEYSNLDILHILDSDVIKLDKHFVDGIGKDMIRDEIILFISRIAESEGKSIILEGVEERNQHDKIREIKNPFLYVQGYFYSKPIYKEEIKNL